MIQLYQRPSSLREISDDTTTSLLAQFIRAAIQPSAPALLGTVGITAVLFALCVVFITPDFMMNGGARYVAAGPTDDYAFVSGDAMRLRQAGPQPLAVALFGASPLREAVSSDDDLKTMLSAGLDRPTAIYGPARRLVPGSSWASLDTSPGSNTRPPYSPPSRPARAIPSW